MSAGDPLPQIQHDRLRASATAQDGVMTLVLSGAADDPAAAEALTRLCGDLHARMVRDRTPQAVVDLRQLEFMNSSCFRSFVIWLSFLQDAESSERYRVRFLANNAMHWQRRSLQALASFAEGLVDIEASGAI